MSQRIIIFWGAWGWGRRELDRGRPVFEHRRKEQLAQRKWSFRISQLGIGAIDLAQIVTRFQAAVADPEEMIVFRCDVLGLPQSTAQALTPAIMDRARSVEPFALGVRGRENSVAFGGLDMGIGGGWFQEKCARLDSRRSPNRRVHKHQHAGPEAREVRKASIGAFDLRIGGCI